MTAPTESGPPPWGLALDIHPGPTPRAVPAGGDPIRCSGSVARRRRAGAPPPRGGPGGGGGGGWGGAPPGGGGPPPPKGGAPGPPPPPRPRTQRPRHPPQKRT